MDPTYKLSKLCGKEKTLSKIVERYWWPELYADIKDWVKPRLQCDTWVQLRYDEPLKSLTVGHLWHWVGMDIFYMPRMEDRYHLVVVAREYLSGWWEARPLTQGTSGEVPDFFHDKLICQLGTADSVAVDGGAKTKKRTNIRLKCYNIWIIATNLYHAAANGVIERGYRPIADALSKPHIPLGQNERVAA